MSYFVKKLRKVFTHNITIEKDLNSELKHLIKELKRKKEKTEKALKKAVQPTKKKSLRLELKILNKEIEKAEKYRASFIEQAKA